jgi:hypothetical protein
VTRCCHWSPLCQPGEELVARGGVEPPTFRFSVGRSYQLSYLAVSFGHATRASGGAVSRVSTRNAALGAAFALAVLTGLEPATSALTGRRALQLLHRTLLLLRLDSLHTIVPVPPTGFEPVLPP